MLVQRIIVEDARGVCVTNNFLVPFATESEIRQAFADKKLPVLRLDIDDHGVALVKVGQTLPLSSWKPF